MPCKACSRFRSLAYGGCDAEIADTECRSWHRRGPRPLGVGCRRSVYGTATADTERGSVGVNRTTSRGSVEAIEMTQIG